MRYFKRYWDEPRGDPHNAWGGSWWYFETNDAGVVTSRVEVYDHSPTLRYDERRVNDEFGGMSDQPLDLGEFAVFEILHEEFQRVWVTNG